MPETFGRYIVLDEIAQGGMARVYRARYQAASGFAKRVALKRILPTLADDPEFVSRFAAEAKIASTLDHSNIIQVFDFGEVQGEYFLAMELVEGRSLSQLLRQGALPLPAALYVGAAMARGLGAAHNRVDEHGNPAAVVHRDVSPQNVLLSNMGAVKVGDFGIAKAGGASFRTKTGLVLGKCRYMAPEQAAGQEVAPPTDVFSTGIVLFEMLTGRHLFCGKAPEQILDRVLRQPIPPLSRCASNIPAQVEQIVAHALERDQKERFVDGDALARELEHVLHTEAPGFSCDDLAELVRGRDGTRRSMTSDSGTMLGRPRLPTEEEPLDEPLEGSVTKIDGELPVALAPTEQSPEEGIDVRQAQLAQRPTRLLTRAEHPPRGRLVVMGALVSLSALAAGFTAQRLTTEELRLLDQTVQRGEERLTRVPCGSRLTCLAVEAQRRPILRHASAPHPPLLCRAPHADDPRWLCLFRKPVGLLEVKWHPRGGQALWLRIDP